MPRLLHKIGVAGLASLGAILFLFSAGASQQQNHRARFGAESSLPAGIFFDGGYFLFWLLAENSGTVKRDVFAFAGQVLIDGRVNGDVIVSGGRVKISGAVAQDVRAAGGHVTITGNIGRNLTVAGGNVELASSAAVRGGLVAAGGNIDVSSPVGGDSRGAAGTLI